MKVFFKRIAWMALICLMALASCVMVACGGDLTTSGSVDSVTICYLGKPVGEEGIKVNLIQETVALSVRVETTGNASDEVTLTSSDTEVATISTSGTNVLLHKAGTTTLTATSVVDAEKTHSVTLTVEPIVPEVLSVAIKDENGAAFQNDPAEIALGGTLNVTVEVQVRGEMTTEYTLISNDESIVTVEEGDVLAAAGVGVTTVTATSVGDTSKTATLNVLVYDSTPQALSVVGGVAKNANGQIVEEAVKGDKITLVPDEAADGMVFVAWNVSGASVNVINNEFTFPGVALNFEAVYGYTPSDFALNFGAGSYTCSTDNQNKRVHITYSGIANTSWDNINTIVDYPDSANYNRFAYTVTNHGSERVQGTAALGPNTTPADAADRLNGSNGTEFVVEAGETKTFVGSYTPANVRNLLFFIDSNYWDVPQENKSGDITISNIAFFAEAEVASVTITDANDNPFENNEAYVNLEDGPFNVKVVVKAVGGASQEYTLESDNEEVLTVTSEGLVTPIKGGQAKITATSTADSSKKAVIEVYVLTTEKYEVNVTGGKAQIGGADVTEAKAGDVLTLVADEPESGMEFVAWNITTASGGKSTIRANTYTMTSEETEFEAVYGRTANYTPNFTGDWGWAYDATISGTTATIVWKGEFQSNWWAGILAAVDDANTANCNRISITVTNPGDKDFTLFVGISKDANDAAGNRLGEGEFTVKAGTTQTFVLEYSSELVKSLQFFFDAGDSEDKPVGEAIVSNIAFYTVAEVTSIAITDENGAPFENNKTSVKLEDGSFKVKVDVKVLGGASQEYTLESDNEEVLTVTSEGVVTLVGSGHAKITATSTADGEKKAAIDVEVLTAESYALSVTGGKAQIDGTDVTEAKAGDVITLVPNEGEEGMAFVAWNITTASGKSTIRTNTYTMTSENTQFEAVYGRTANFALSFTYEEWTTYNVITSGSEATVEWNGGFEPSWYSKVFMQIDYPQTANCNQFSFTITNLTGRDIFFLVGINTAKDNDNDAGRLNGDGSNFTVHAGMTETFTITYTKAEVGCVAFAFDCGEGSDKPTGKVQLSNMAFYSEGGEPSQESKLTIKSGKAQINGADVAVADVKAGDVLTLVADEPQSGMELVAWNITTASGISTIRTNTYTMTDEITTIEAVYGRTANYTPNFTGDWAYDATISGTTATIAWKGEFQSNWWAGILTTVDDANTANCNRISITVTNTGDEDFTLFVGISKVADDSDTANNRLGEGEFTVKAGTTQTFVLEYNSELVKSLQFFFAVGESEDKPVGEAIVSNIAFFKE